MKCHVPRLNLLASEIFLKWIASDCGTSWKLCRYKLQPIDRLIVAIEIFFPRSGRMMN